MKGPAEMTEQLATRRGLLKTSGALVVWFSLGAAFRAGGRGALAQDAATPAPAATPVAVLEPGNIAIPENQTEENVETHDVSGNAVDSWLAVAPDGTVTIFSGKVELGTGTETAISQIVAEELSVPFDRITVIMGDTAQTPDQGYTSGSKTLQTSRPILQQAGAVARQELFARAAKQLGVAADALVVKDGVISVADDASKSVPYGDLVSDPFNEKVGTKAPLKPVSEYTVVGQPVERVDIPAKLFGIPIYIQDLRLDGMLHGRIVRPYVRHPDGIGTTVESIDESSVKDIPGVQVVRNGNFVGVVAEREENAIRAAEQLKVTWSAQEPMLDEATLFDQILKMPVARDAVLQGTGDVDKALKGAKNVVKARYEYPFQAHGSIGPSCAVADVKPDGATVYSSTQGVYPLRGALAQLLGLKAEQVRVIYVEGAGCYGHNGFDDCAGDATLLSQAVKKPVRVQWMRQDEFAYELKGPAMVMQAQGALDDKGNMLAWDYGVWTQTHSTRPGNDAGNLLAGQLKDPPAPVPNDGFVGGDRNGPHSYVFPNNRVTVHWLNMFGLRPSALRSLGAMGNVFAVESFFDEMAAAAGADPVE
ncbi:MAG: molybdopterin-dependent oxidoreductase, partial [Thermomicrobiales bacterium]|nr:molybdopterin-dependent oxidoreductase [Thermomicrobiales bacterium]